MAESDRSMTPDQAHKMLSYFNQADPRIEVNPANVRIFARALGKFEPQLITDVFERFMENNAEDRKLSAGALKKLCQAEFEAREREKARRELTHDPSLISFGEWKKRYPGRALECYQSGYRESHGVDDPKPPSWTRDDSPATPASSFLPRAV